LSKIKNVKKREKKVARIKNVKKRFLHMIWGHGPMANAVARAYIGGLGVEPPAGSRSRVLDSPPPPWSWSTFGLWTFNESHKFAHFSTIWKRKKSDICVVLPKILGGHETGGLEQNWWACDPGPGL